MFETVILPIHGAVHTFLRPSILSKWSGLRELAVQHAGVRPPAEAELLREGGRRAGQAAPVGGEERQVVARHRQVHLQLSTVLGRVRIRGGGDYP